MKLESVLYPLISLITLVAAKPLHFKNGDVIPVIVNKIGPFSNPTETYQYYQLPFCQPESVVRGSQGIGEVISGDRKIVSPYTVRFKEDIIRKVLCDKPLSDSEVKLFQRGIDEEYFYEVLVDSLPAWAYIGDSPSLSNIGDDALELIDQIAEQKKFLYTHLHFKISYNKDQIVGFQVFPSSDPVDKLDVSETRPMTATFSYSVSWQESDVSYNNRFMVYNDGNLLPKSFEIHWLGIMNSFIFVVILVIFLVIMLARVIKNDFTRYMKLADAESLVEEAEETGWKLLHGDVFRFPRNAMLFSATIGAGSQLFCLATLLLLLIVCSVLSPAKRGSLVTAVLCLYALTSFIGGYVSGRLYKQMGGLNWVWNVVLSASLFPVPFTFIFSILNSVAIFYESTAAVPVGTIALVFFSNVLITVPLTIMGASLGKSKAEPFDASSRTMKIPRRIPEQPFFHSLGVQLFWAGFFPFTVIAVELHHIFGSLWGHKIYTLFGILSLAFFLLVIVAGLVTVCLVYLQLNTEDYRWWWRSVLLGGSAGLFVFGYSILYFFQKTEMMGFLQTSFYFGYMLIISYAFSLLLAPVGYFFSITFIRRIYKEIKTD